MEADNTILLYMWITLLVVLSLVWLRRHRRACPHCRESMKWRARVCPHCGLDRREELL
jgi:predicted amidophosphoribosyltransferase